VFNTRHYGEKLELIALTRGNQEKSREKRRNRKMNSFGFQKICGLMVFALSLCICSDGFADKGIAPDVILERMHDVYAKAETYQDAGVVETIMDLDSRKQAMTQTFSIVFKRPSSIKIEWIDIMLGGQKSRFVLWSDGKLTQTFWEQLNQVQKSQSLMMGIAGAAGVSGGAAQTVPSMLLKDLHMPTLSVLTNMRLLKEEVFEGVECYVIVGKHPVGFDYTLWIGKSDYLLRKLEYVVKSHKEALKDAEVKIAKIKKEHKISVPDTFMTSDFSSVNRQIHRDIKINKELPDSALTFTPPQNAKHVDSFEVGQ
jgi:outer membrane lipoprotein-sorting protein